jgi:hypothetical protein
MLESIINFFIDIQHPRDLPKLRNKPYRYSIDTLEVN